MDAKKAVRQVIGSNIVRVSSALCSHNEAGACVLRSETLGSLEFPVLWLTALRRFG